MTSAEIRSFPTGKEFYNIPISRELKCCTQEEFETQRMSPAEFCRFASKKDCVEQAGRGKCIRLDAYNSRLGG